MKKIFLLIFTLFLLVGCSTPSIQIASDCDSYQLVEEDRNLLFVCLDEPTPEPTATATNTPSPEPSTTPSPEPTSSPTPMPTPTTVGSLPLCVNHDVNEWHSLISHDGTCHYDHTHGDDPDSIDGLPDWPFENSISYPHQTPNENQLKHEGYKVYVFDTNGQCVNRDNNQNCVIGGRLQFHVVGGATGMNTRFHSYYGQFILMNSDGSIGTVSTGGWADFGILHCPYKTAHCPLAEDPTSFNILQPPYRAARDVRAVDDGVAQWNAGCFNSAQVPCETNQILASYDWVAFNDFGGVNPDNLSELVISDDPNRNHTQIRFYEFVVDIPLQLDDEIANFRGFTDLNGNIDMSCTETNAVCVPLIIENIQGGRYTFRTSVGTSGPVPMDEYFRNWDLSPADEVWIEYPN